MRRRFGLAAPSFLAATISSQSSNGALERVRSPEKPVPSSISFLPTCKEAGVTTPSTTVVLYEIEDDSECAAGDATGANNMKWAADSSATKRTRLENITGPRLADLARKGKSAQQAQSPIDLKSNVIPVRVDEKDGDDDGDVDMELDAPGDSVIFHPSNANNKPAVPAAIATGKSGYFFISRLLTLCRRRRLGRKCSVFLAFALCFHIM